MLVRVCAMLSILAIPAAVATRAQPFSFDLRTTDLASSVFGRVFPADLDGDGDADLVIAGAASVTADAPTLVQARMVPPVSESYQVSFDTGALDRPVWHASGAWLDANRDGRPDLLLTGTPDMDVAALGMPSAAETTLYLLGEDGVLRPSQAGFARVFGGSVAVADVDLDGDTDAWVSGMDAAGRPVGDVWRNRGDGSFEPTGSSLPALVLGAAAFADADGDGYPDLALSGATAAGAFRSVLAHNEVGTFSVVQELEPLGFSTLAWGDVDGDGAPDLVLAGGRFGRAYQLQGITRLYRNDRGTLRPIDHAIPGVVAGSARFGDLDQDGDLDLAIMGLRNFTGDPVAVVMENRLGSFSTLATLPGAWGGSLEVVDLDGDRDLDLVISGQDASTVGFVQVVANVSRIANHEPAVPENLAATVQGRDVTLSWSPSSDAVTPAPLLQYEVRVGTVAGGGDVVSAFSDPATGTRRFARPGNAGAATAFALRNLPAGTYHWTVQALDAAFTGSAFAPEASFILAGGKAGSTAAETSDLPVRFDVAPAWPNPFAGRTSLLLDLPAAGNVSADVFDAAGRRVARLVDGVLPPGRHPIEWDGRTDAGSTAPAGVFAVRVRADATVMTRLVVHLHP